jgi:hypothetical protein
MIALPEMLISPAEKAGMKVPENPREYDHKKYPHFWILEACQLGAPMPYPSCVWDNAKLIAALSDEQAKSITYKELLEMGFAVGHSSVLA